MENNRKMALKSEPVVNHVWTTNTPEELNTLVAGYIAGGWKVLEVKVTQVDRYNRMLEVFYIFVKNEAVYEEVPTVRKPSKREKEDEEVAVPA